jgi:hypothetical protein
LRTALTGRPHLSAARESEREVAGRLGEVGRLLGFGSRGKKRKRQVGLGGLERGLGEGWSVLYFFQFLFFYFLFKLLLKTFSKIFKQTFDHTINQNPCIQHDAQTFGFSKLINYHCIYLKAI